MCECNQSLITDKTQLNRGVCLFQYKLYTDTLRLDLPSFTLMCSHPTTFNYLIYVVFVGSFAAAWSKGFTDTVQHIYIVVNPTSLGFKGSEGFIANCRSLSVSASVVTSCCYSNPNWHSSIATIIVTSSFFVRSVTNQILTGIFYPAILNAFFPNNKTG